jgi:hypothetical protein
MLLDVSQHPEHMRVNGESVLCDGCLARKIALGDMTREEFFAIYDPPPAIMKKIRNET